MFFIISLRSKYTSFESYCCQVCQLYFRVELIVSYLLQKSIINNMKPGNHFSYSYTISFTYPQAIRLNRGVRGSKRESGLSFQNWTLRAVFKRSQAPIASKLNVKILLDTKIMVYRHL